MKKFLVTLFAAVLLIATPTAAFAGGSNDPTPYSVTVEGITLPDGQVFQDGGHINVRTTTNTVYNLHFEDRNWPMDSPKRFYIGKSFIPWSAFGIPEGQACIQWVQIHGFNEHFGEGGQPVVGPDCAAPSDPEDPKTTPTTPPTTPPVTPEPTETPVEPSPEPSETPQTPEPTETPGIPTPEETTTPPGPLNPAGGDMTGFIVGGALGLMGLGAGVIIARIRTRKEDA